MEKTLETQVETSPIFDNKISHNLHGSSNHQNSAAINVFKPVTPDRLKVPKAFKYTERYSSPTDLMMSPVSRGLLARGRKASAPLPVPPFKNQSNICF